MKDRLLGLAVLFFCGLSVMGADCAPQPIELRIFHTNDLHSTFRPHPTDPFELGGMARMKTLLDRLRSQTSHHLTLDAGDWSDGTWYYSVDTGANMLRLMDLMGFDAVALGNHDFLNGPSRLLGTIEEARPRFPVLAANIDPSGYADPAAFRERLPATWVKQFDGFKVGVIGLTTFELTYSSYLEPVRITNLMDAATRAARELRPQVDLLVVVSHNAFETNQQLARAVPGVDAVISGHAHVKTPKAVLIENAGRQVPVVETGSSGRFLGDLRFQLIPSQRVVRYAGFELHPVLPELPEDTQVAAFIRDQDSLLNREFGDDVDRIVAHAELPLPHEDDLESPLGVLAAKSYRALTGADLALEGMALTGLGIAAGPATLMDLHDVIPHLYDHRTHKEWTVWVWEARGSDLSLVLNVFYHLSAWIPVGGPLGWVTGDPLQILWDPGAIDGDVLSKVVKAIRIGGKPLDPQARYRVALNEGLLYGIRRATETFGLGIDLSRLEDTGTEAWRAVVQYASGRGRLTREDLGPAGRAVTEGADLAIPSDRMEWQSNRLFVRVENRGLSPSRSAEVRCESGLPNDPVRWMTPEQSWSPVVSEKLPNLEPLGHVTLELAWAPLLEGRVPIRCTVQGSEDEFRLNDAGQRVFRVKFEGNSLADGRI